MGIRLGFVLFTIGSLEGMIMIINQAHTIGAADGGPGPAVPRVEHEGGRSSGGAFGWCVWDSSDAAGWLRRAPVDERSASSSAACIGYCGGWDVGVSVYAAVQSGGSGAADFGA
jgi:hypothetical protein